MKYVFRRILVIKNYFYKERFVTNLAVCYNRSRLYLINLSEFRIDIVMTNQSDITEAEVCCVFLDLQYKQKYTLIKRIMYEI